jgi:hydroxylamine reductase
MFCYQCEQTAKGTGCTVQGVCGKDDTTAVLQDLLVYAAKGVAMYAHRAARALGGMCGCHTPPAPGARDRKIDVGVIEALFTTVTNVDFDPQRIGQYLGRAAENLQRARSMYQDACAQAGKTPETLSGPAAWQPADGLAGLVDQGREVSIANRRAKLGEDVAGLQELITYGLKGAAAYVDHAQILGREDPQVYATFHEALDFLTRDDTTTDELLGWALKTGELNLKAMELLDAANTGAYGHPEPTEVRVTPRKGKAIVVSGHDLKDLEELLKQTAGREVNVYTHGEMLPALAYPDLKKYQHLVGNYGGAWQDQRKEFDEFPGAILMTTNCIQKPKEGYQGRIFTSGLVAWPNVTHIGPDRDFTPLIEAALAAPGFDEDAPERTITVGFARHAVLGVAEKVVQAAKAGAIRHFFLIGGCDGAKSGRNYYTDFAKAVPRDCVILTLACGKYRFNKLDFGSIDGIPRLLDVGQCNDAYSAVQIALALAGALDCEVNELPLSLILSWYEQKAVAILLTLLHLGLKNIRLGPSLPAFVTPPVWQVLVEKFNLAPIGTPQRDLQAILGSKGNEGEG